MRLLLKDETTSAINKYLLTRDVELFSMSLLELIKREGYVYIDQNASFNLFKSIGKTLGNIINLDNIEVNEHGNYAAYRADKIFPHTDTAEAQIMGWWCEMQDEVDGTSILIDTKKIIDTFNSYELTRLKTMTLNYKNLSDKTLDSFSKFNDTPLIYEKWGELKINYAPWLTIECTNNSDEILVTKFLNNLNKAVDKDSINIRLEPGQFLFIDNGRLLHSRNSISKNSKRCLKRLWINTEGKNDNIS